MAKSTPYLKRADNGIWYVHWTEDRIGKRVTTREYDIANARKILGAYLLEGGPIASPRLSKIWAIYCEKHVDVKMATPQSAHLSWKQLRPYFASLRVSDLNQDAVDEYVTKRTSGRLGRKVAPPTVLRELVYLRAALRFCADRGFVSAKYVRKLQLPEPGEPRQRWLRDDEIARLKEAARARRKQKGGHRAHRLSRVERFIALALETGARQQALLDLTWERVDFEIGTIELDVPGRRKTKKGRATVPISDALLPVLERAYAERICDLVLDNNGAIWPGLQRVAIDAALVDESNRSKKRRNPKATGVSANVFRHTAATIMARHGAPIFKIAKILGNSPRMIERVYAKHQPEDLREAVNLISNDPKKPK
ncbi:integrase [Mesorhizobium huakuii]|uniref:tyrosine-type recombinase/integrase n=1 Tax=Mesorhizobium huakuii TaxID=28104 RepID=UPI00235D1200|nr:site-specific integrase [Mesorhizobium huakuii]GLQ82612.1 integrase [Mesorhizobium huakuii]